MDALVTKYGELRHPFWARVLTVEVAAVGRHLHPAKLAWVRPAVPYVGGDPYTYIKFAREMRGFYQGHVREPVFLAVTRAFLRALSGRDVAVSYASALGSTLLVVAAYLLGGVAFGRWVGLAAALALAIEYQAIDWGVDGWRDDTFAAAFTFAAWAFLRVRRNPSLANAALAGVMAALACLTRITACVFVVPALAWLVVDAPATVRVQRLRAAGVALVVAAVLVAPYLVNCARELGDPLVAVNYHTHFYRFGEGLPSDKPMTAARYIASKIEGHPIAALDTATTGVFVWPLDAKGGGLDCWVPGLRRVFLVTSSLGLILMLGSPTGRLLLVILLFSLVPYALTWNVRGGGEWRFTLHAYAIYLVAAAYFVERTTAGAWALGASVRGPRQWPSRRTMARAGGAVAVGALVVYAYRQLPYYVIREAVKDGTPASIIASDRDAPFFADGWTDPQAEGNVTARVSIADRATVRLPMPDARPYDLVLRLDPVAPDAQSSFVALLNGRMLGRQRFTWDPQRVGLYRFSVPADLVRPGTNRLAMLAEPLVESASVLQRYPFLEPYRRAGLRMWYVRIEPK